MSYEDRGIESIVFLISLNGNPTLAIASYGNNNNHLHDDNNVTTTSKTNYGGDDDDDHR